MIAKRISTEEEAKAALAERRRIAREEAEKQAELERKRKEAEEIAEQQRIIEEEENQRRLEEETLRLVEEQKKAEELRLLQAIEVRSFNLHISKHLGGFGMFLLCRISLFNREIDISNSGS